MKGAVRLSKQYCAEPKGRKFLSAAAFILTIVIMILLNILRKYADSKYPQYMPDAPSLPEKMITALMIIFAAVYVVFIVLLLPMWYKSIRYVINDREIISCSGIFSRTYRIMKLSAVQHAVRISMPLSRITCFNFISLDALGGSMKLMFLSEANCNEIMKIFRSGSAEQPQKKPDAERQRTQRAPLPADTSDSYSVTYSSDGGDSYTYADSPYLYAPGLADDYRNFTQLSFGDLGLDLDTDGQSKEGDS